MSDTNLAWGCEQFRCFTNATFRTVMKHLELNMLQGLYPLLHSKDEDKL